MGFGSLKSKLLIAVSALVISTGVLISLLTTHRYSKSLIEAMTLQAKSLACAVAVEADDKIIVNDLAALQKLLTQQMRSSSSLSYLFIMKDGQVLAHTFAKDIPAELIKVHNAVAGHQAYVQKIASSDGEQYLDVGWPVLEGKGGVLRLGYSQRLYRQQINKLWVEISLLTLAALLLGLGGSLLLVRRITRPLGALARATQKIEQGEVGVRVEVHGEDEVGKLAASFNDMIARIEEYTGRLEEQTMELERAHQQTRTFCGIVREIGGLQSLNEIGPFLMKKFQEILKCSHMELLILNGGHDLLFTLSVMGAKALKDPKAVETARAALESLKKITFTKKVIFRPPLVPDGFESGARQAIVPLLHDNRPFGALIIPCPGECGCDFREIDAVGMILAQASGIIKRAVLQEEEIREMRRRVDHSAEFSGIVGKDPKMQVIYKLIEDIAPTDATVLIQGESGTGKELVASAIHQLSPRKEEPFVVINCSAYPATLLESELFGHEKGAFTGAVRRKIGRFEQAHGGTVFLDEIGEISPSAQIKLLRVLQSQKFERLGGEHTLAVDVRILAATNRDLLQEVKKGHFREDLYYRLNVIPIHLPPLRERGNDIPLLARHFLRCFAEEQGKEVRMFSPEAMRILLDHSWPGNVRELENSIEHATVLAKGDRIQASDLPSVLHAATSLAHAGRQSNTMVEHERNLLQQALEECGWNKKQAAQHLGISRNTLYVKLKKYQITRPTTH